MAVTFTATAELFIDGDWLDITRLDDAGAPTSDETLGHTRVIGPISVRRGRADLADTVTPTEVRFRYRDDLALLSASNPASPFHGKVGLGTPLRVSIDGNVRAVVELVSITPDWDAGGEGPDGRRAVFLDIVGAGILKRLEETGQPLRSPAYRALSSEVNSDEMVALFPLEEESDATTIAAPFGGSVTIGGPGEFSFGAGESVSAARLARFDSFDTFLTVTLPTWTNTLGQHFVGHLMRGPEGGLADNAIIHRMYFTGGDIDFVDLLHTSGDGLRLTAYQGGILIDTLAATDWTGYIDEQREIFLIVTLHQNGADVDVRIRGTTAGTWLVSASDTMTARTLGTMYQMVIATGSGCDGMEFGMLVIGSNKDAFGNFVDDRDSDADYVVTGARGYAFERAGDRMDRLSDEVGAGMLFSGSTAFTSRLDVQRADETVTGLWREGEKTDGGILFENRTTAVPAYRTRRALQNQTPVFTFDYAHLSPGFRPVSSSDLRVVNDMTIQRSGGSSARYVIPDGDVLHWSTQDPPDGGYRRPGQDTLSLAEDADAIGQAAWRAHVQSWREDRYSQVIVELHRDAFTADDRAGARAIGIGEAFAVSTTGAPPWIPLDEVRLLCNGLAETFDQNMHTIAFNTTQNDMWDIEMPDVTDSLLAVAIDDNDTTVKIHPGRGRGWSTTSEPYHIMVDGQPMTVTAMTTGTITVIGAGAGVSNANAAGTGTLAPGFHASTAAGDTVILAATIRNSGTGTVDTATLVAAGWTVLAGSGTNAALLGKVVTQAEVTAGSVTVGFSGGVANATITAGTLTARDCSLSHGGGITDDATARATPVAAVQLNSSAANIGYPALYVVRDGCLVIVFGWKQDDFTSVAQLAGMTEIDEQSETGGDDASHVWDYVIQTTATDIAAGSFSVTGGANAISRGYVVALRPLHSATVTRGVAGLATSAAAGAAVHAWRPGVAAL